jgi:hypothetical protein
MLSARESNFWASMPLETIVVSGYWLVIDGMNFGVETKHVQRLYKGFYFTQNHFHALNSTSADNG